MTRSVITCQEFRLKLHGVQIGEEIVTEDGLARHATGAVFFVIFCDAVVRINGFIMIDAFIITVRNEIEKERGGNVQNISITYRR